MCSNCTQVSIIIKLRTFGDLNPPGIETFLSLYFSIYISYIHLVYLLLIPFKAKDGRTMDDGRTQCVQCVQKRPRVERSAVRCSECTAVQPLQLYSAPRSVAIPCSPGQLPSRDPDSELSAIQTRGTCDTCDEPELI